MSLSEKKDIHLSLDQAREELKKRWNDKKLKKSIEEELGKYMLSGYNDKPRAILTRQLCSPDNGFTFFYQCAKYINATPFLWEFHGDTFVHFNEDKKGLSRLRITLEGGEKATVEIFDLHKAEKKKLFEIVTKTKENLVDFHHNLMKISRYDVETRDNTSWFRSLGRATDYYYSLLLHFVAHGVLFNNFESYEDDGSASIFMRDIVNPAIARIEEKFGYQPMVFRMFSTRQNEEEDFYWWSYPRMINGYIVNYAKENKLSFKQVISHVDKF